MSDDLILPRDAARLLGVSPATLRTFAREGSFEPAVVVTSRIRLYARRDVEAFAERRRATGLAPA
jgi:DNA-binding transcriptional MerR regulator